MLSDDQIIQSCIQMAAEDDRIDVLWLYGSRAKGTDQPDSDYDFAVAFSVFPEKAWDRRLQSELLALDWSERLGLSENQLSVADINLIPLPLAFNVIQSGQSLLVKNPLRLAREENRITSMWEIDYQYHRQMYG